MRIDSWRLDDLFGIERGDERWMEISTGDWESSLKGTTRHPEICRAISEGRKGIIFSEEHRKNLSEAHKGQRRSHSQETKDKISKTNKGKRRTASHRESISEKTREAMKKLNQETYKFISPEGEEIIRTTTLAEFAREHNLNKALLSQVKNGNRNHHKGWRVFHISGEIS